MDESRRTEVVAELADKHPGVLGYNSVRELQTALIAAEAEIAALREELNDDIPALIERYYPSVFSQDLGFPARGKETTLELLERVCSSDAKAARNMGVALTEYAHDEEVLLEKLRALRAQD